MTQIIEEKMVYCDNCKKDTKHYRNNSKSSGFMIFLHLVLTIGTVGVWLILVVIWKILNAKIGGWRCPDCQTEAGAPTTIQNSR